MFFPTLIGTPRRVHSAFARAGFTLVELSIVLVILGLLVGGVLTGQSLIRAAEIRTVVTDYQRFVTAIQTFDDKYSAYPGDMTNATTYWGKDNTNCSTDTGTTATPGTCNGNGDGLLDMYGTPPSRETLHLWQQLVLAGLIEGNYTGLGASSGGFATIAVGVPGVNIPRSKVGTGNGWSTFYLPQNNSEAGSYSDLPAVSYQFLFLAGYNSNYWANIPNVLRPEEVYNIDRKIDDGKPFAGNVRGGYNYAGWDNCITTNLTNTAAYNVSSSNKVCLIAFKLFP